MLAGWGSLESIAIGEPVVRIKCLVANIIERGAVEVVPSGAGNKRYLPTRLAPELRGVRGRLYTELLQGVDRNETGGGAGSGIPGELP